MDWNTGAVRALAILLTLTLTVTAAVPGAAAGAADRPAAPRATAAVTACTATDSRLIGLSGIAVTADGYIAVTDSNVDKSAIRIFFLDSRCRLVRSIGYPTSAYDPEDLAVGRDGTLYVADIGDNGATRRSVAIWRVPPGGQPHIVRYAYPDGAHDAEALLLAADDAPIIVTKDPLVAGVYTPTGPPDPGGAPVPLRKVGTFTPSPTGTSSGVGPLGGFVVTGGANAPDRSKVALRTYSDAYEWPVPDGDVVKAITSGHPAITPLPDEPQGESIGYTRDGSAFVTVSDQEDSPVHTDVLRYPSAVTAPASPSAAAGSRPTTGTTAAGAAPAAGHRADGPVRWLLLAAVAGVALLGVGLLAVALARRRRPG